MATGGFGTRITTETPEKLKAALGGVSYFVHGLLRMDTLQADRCEIRGPDFRWAGEALVIGIGNGKQAGGGQELCPSALINDGLLQLRLLIADELLPALVAALFNDEESNSILSAALPWLEIDAPHEMTFNLDGEPLKAVISALKCCRRPSNAACRPTAPYWADLVGRSVFLRSPCRTPSGSRSNNQSLSAPGRSPPRIWPRKWHFLSIASIVCPCRIQFGSIALQLQSPLFTAPVVKTLALPVYEEAIGSES